MIQHLKVFSYEEGRYFIYLFKDSSLFTRIKYVEFLSAFCTDFERQSKYGTICFLITVDSCLLHLVSLMKLLDVLEPRSDVH